MKKIFRRLILLVVACSIGFPITAEASYRYNGPDRPPFDIDSGIGNPGGTIGGTCGFQICHFPTNIPKNDEKH